MMKISEFAALSGISRKSLIFYDHCGVLRPEHIDPENGYRYYSYRQIDTASVIISFREAGMPLELIRGYLTRRTPDNLIEILSEQERRIEEQIKRLTQIKSMVRSRTEQTRRGIAAKAGAIYTAHEPEENIFLGPELPESYELADGWSYLPEFYAACAREEIPVGFTVGTLVSRERLVRGEWDKPERYYCRLPKNRYKSYASKPAGLYVVGTSYADYGETAPLYEKIMEYMKSNGLAVSGGAYEEYLIDEIAERDAKRYLLQISIRAEAAALA